VARPRLAGVTGAAGVNFRPNAGDLQKGVYTPRGERPKPTPGHPATPVPPACTVVVSAASGYEGNATPRVTKLVADGEGRVCLRAEGCAAAELMVPVLFILDLNLIASDESSPEKAGVGGSIPSLATTF
jgi:hypothetical protein